MMKVMNDKLKEREGVRQIEGNHTESYRSLNEEVFCLMLELKQEIWQP